MSSSIEDRLRAERDIPLPVAPSDRVWRGVRRELARDRDRPIAVVRRRWWLLLLLPVIGFAIFVWRTPEYPLDAFALPRSGAGNDATSVGKEQAIAPSAERIPIRSQSESPERADPPSRSPRVDRSPDSGTHFSASAMPTAPESSRSPLISAASPSAPVSHSLSVARGAEKSALPSLIARQDSATRAAIAPLSTALSLSQSGLIKEPQPGSRIRSGRSDQLSSGPAAALYLPPQILLPGPRDPQRRGTWSVRLTAGLVAAKQSRRFWVLDELAPPFTRPPRTFFAPSGEPLHFAEANRSPVRLNEFRPVLRANIGYRFRSGIRLGAELAFVQRSNASPDASGPDLEPTQAYEYFFAEERFLLGGLTAGYERNWRRLTGYVGFTLGRVGYRYQYFGQRLVYAARDLDFPLATSRRSGVGDFSNYSGLDVSLTYRLSPYWTIGPALSLNSAIGDSEFATWSLQVQYVLPRD